VTKVSRPKISLTGKLRYSEAEGVQFSVTVGDRGKERTVWLEAVPSADEWPGIRKTDDNEAYLRTLHQEPSYRLAAKEFLELQRREPQNLMGSFFWAYKDHVVSLDSQEPETIRDKETDALMVKHYVLRRERNYERVRREVDALENLEKLDRVPRQPIQESVRLFVWQRDGGQCVKCGSRERLEFDHIIPLVAGGSNTERNIQLLCETCNRSKGSTI
jgi:5-methylcytosine-specific restriction endonuclease McrA